MSLSSNEIAAIGGLIGVAAGAFGASDEAVERIGTVTSGVAVLYAGDAGTLASPAVQPYQPAPVGGGGGAAPPSSSSSLGGNKILLLLGGFLLLGMRR